MESSPQAIAVRHDYFIPAYKRALFFVLGILITAACLYIYLFHLRATQHLLGSFLSIGLTTVVMTVGIFSLNRSVPSRFVIDGPRLEASGFFGTRTADI